MQAVCDVTATSSLNLVLLHCVIIQQFNSEHDDLLLLLRFGPSCPLVHIKMFQLAFFRFIIKLFDLLFSFILFRTFKTL